MKFKDVPIGQKFRHGKAICIKICPLATVDFPAGIVSAIVLENTVNQYLNGYPIVLNSEIEVSEVE